MKTGVAYLAVAGTAILWSAVAAQLVTRLGVKPVLVTGMTALTAGLVFFTQVSVGGSYLGDLLPGFLLIGLGLGFSFVPISIAALAGDPAGRGGLASGLLNTSQQIGGALGIAALSTIATSRPPTRSRRARRCRSRSSTASRRPSSRAHHRRRRDRRRADAHPARRAGAGPGRRACARRRGLATTMGRGLGPGPRSPRYRISTPSWQRVIDSIATSFGRNAAVASRTVRIRPWPDRASTSFAVSRSSRRPTTPFSSASPVSSWRGRTPRARRSPRGGRSRSDVRRHRIGVGDGHGPLVRRSGTSAPATPSARWR